MDKFSLLINSYGFHLTAMLICIIVVVFLFISGYRKGKDPDESAKVDRQRLHKYYISGILVFIIIELVTGICMDNSESSDILNYVNFAATLSSLILSVVAIIFTIVSSSRGDEQFRKIDGASDKVLDVSEKVSQALTEFANKTVELGTSVSDYKIISSELKDYISEILARLSDIKANTEDLKNQGAIQALKDKDEEKGDNKFDTDKFVSNFVNTGSFNGCLALYACVLSKDYNKPFDLSDVSIDGNDVSYRYGYIVSSFSAGVIVGKLVKHNCKIDSYYDGFKELLEKKIKKYINRLDEEKKRAAQDRYDIIVNFFNKEKD